MTYDKETTWRIDFHKALSNPVRLQIVDFLAKGEQCQCDIFPQIGLGQPTVSAYLTQMVRAGILKVRKDGTRKLYSIASPTILRAIESLRVLAEKQVNV